MADLPAAVAPPVAASRTMPVMAVGIAAVVAAVATAWLHDRRRQEPVAVRTRDRLAPWAGRRAPPSAADIRVG